MADPLLIEADLELFLTTWYRAALAARSEPICQNVEVDIAEPLPGKPFPEKLVVIRVDNGSPTSFLTHEVDVGVNVLAGSKASPKDANDLVRIVYALRTQIPAVAPGNPVAAVVDSITPVAVQENQPHARRYFSMTLATVGEPL